MKNIKITSGKVDLIFLIAAYIVTLIACFSTYYINTDSNIEIGSISDRKYVASATTENTRETEKLRQAAMDAVGDVYVTDNAVMPQVLEALEAYFDDVSDMREEYSYKEEETDLTELDSYKTVSENTDIKLTQTELKTLSELSETEYSDFKSNIAALVTETLEGGVSDADAALLNIKESLYLSSVDNSLVGVGYDIVMGALKNNVFVDEEATAAAKAKAAEEISPVLILKNQKIVDENEVITEEAYYALEACGFIRAENYKMNLIPFGGKCLLITVTFLGILLYFINFNRKRILHGNEGLLLFTLYIILILISIAVSSFNYVFIPILGFLAITTLLLSTGISLIFIPVVTTITMLITEGDFSYFLYFIVSGHIMVLMVCVTKKRGKALFNGFTASVISGIVMLGISFVNGSDIGLMTLVSALVAALVSFVYVLVAVGSLYVWEALFGIASDLRLSELVNPDQPLIKRLLLEAPGTYQHSLVVANLAETATYDIGANPTLARVGAYYHDIGKLTNPQYFTENIKGDSPHDHLDAYTSVRIIKQHVEDGLALGKKFKLPSPILDIIYEHHGTGIIKFFYYKAKNNKKSTREVKEEDFRYPCRKPSSKESAVIMISDTTEAAVRSIMANKKEDEVVDLNLVVKGIIEEKIKDGQLIDSGLTIKDIDTVQNTLADILKGMYHNRIAYPKEDEKDNKQTEAEKKTPEGGTVKEIKDKNRKEAAKR
ncbi:MAG: HDIG domain-containing protein [Clostridiales bacterium]|nr:HDIG domain-containing protein [Clostridiales bacterium]